MSTVARTASTRTDRRPPDRTTDRSGGGDEFLRARIGEAQSALWRAELARAIIQVTIFMILGLVAWAMMDHWVWSPGRLFRTVALLSGFAVMVGWGYFRLRPLVSARIRPEYAAFSLERDLPELRHALSSYVALRDDQNLEGVRGVVVRSIGARAANQLKQNRIDLPSEAAGNMIWWIALTGALLTAVLYWIISPKDSIQSAQRLLMPLAAIEPVTRVNIGDVLPGDAEVLSGRPLEVSARIDGLASKDAASIQYGPGLSMQAPLTVDSADGRHSAVLVVHQPTTYRIVAGDSVSPRFQIRTRDVPTVTVDQVEIEPPSYTRSPRRSSSGGAIVGEENGIATVVASTNRPIQRANVEFNPRKVGGRILASAGSLEMRVGEDGQAASASFALRLPRNGSGMVAIDSYRIRVWDGQGQENPDPIEYPVRIIPDLAPEISVVTPRSGLDDQVKEVPLDAQQLIEAQVLDPDYGLKRVELMVERGVDAIAQPVLWSSDEGQRGTQLSEYRFRPSSLGLRIGDRVRLTFVALDNRTDPEGTAEPNRTLSFPIELKIVPPRPVPPAGRPEDGLSEVDDQEATGENAPQDGEATQSSGGQGSSGEGGEPQSDDNQSEEGQGGAGQAASGGESEQRDESEPSGEGSTGSSSPTRDESGDTPSKATAQDGGDSADESGDGSGDESGDDSSSDPGGQPGQDDGARGSAGETGQGETGQSAAGTQENSDGASANQTSTGESADTRESGGAGADAPPQHDGEAFERIRDFIEKQENRPQQPGEPPPGEDRPNDSQPGQPQEAPGSSAQSEPTQPPPSQQPQSGGAADSEPRGPQDDRSTSGQPPNDVDEQPDANRQRNETGGGEEGNGLGEADGSQSASDRQSRSGQDSKAGQSASPSGASQDAISDESSEGQSEGEQAGEGQPGAGQAADHQAGGEQSGRDQAPGDQPASDQPAGDQPASDQPAGDSAADGRSSDSGSAGSSDSADRGSDDTGAESRSGQDPSAGGQAGTGGDLGAERGIDAASDDDEVPRPPDAVDLEYAKKATDLVLDYLRTQRDAPDPQLLKELNWNADELRQFTDRWNETRQRGGAVQDDAEVAEVLRSLGLRQPTTGPTGPSRQTDDGIRGLRDSGNRVAPPAIHRDAFDAFRRSVDR